MIILSYLVCGFLFGALVFGLFAVSYKRSADAHLFETLNETRRADRVARLAIAEAQRKVHLNMRRALGRDHRRMLRSAQAQLTNALTGYDMACASIDAHEETISDLSAELTERKRQIMALHFDCEGMEDTIKGLRVRVADLAPRAVKRATWKRERRADRRALSVLAREAVNVTERDQLIGRLQSEAVDTGSRLAAVTVALEEVKHRAEEGAETVDAWADFEGDEVSHGLGVAGAALRDVVDIAAV